MSARTQDYHAIGYPRTVRRTDHGSECNIQVACRFTEEQAEWLRQQADRNDVSIARIIRLCVDRAGMIPAKTISLSPASPDDGRSGAS